MNKSDYRRAVKERLSQADPADLAVQSQAIERHFLNAPEFSTYRHIAAYVSMSDEVVLDLQAIINNMGEKQNFLLPRYDVESDSYDMVEISDLVRDTVVGKYGILEPSTERSVQELNEKTLVLIPGRAFTKSGIRLGRGRAYYDRLLSASSALKVGVCWDEQIFADLPCEARDISMDYLLTRDGFLKCT